MTATIIYQVFTVCLVLLIHRLLEFSQQLCEVGGVPTIFAHEAQRREGGGVFRVRDSMDLKW